jgi:aryl-alcohol dehydrogenase-like predicted oxidoreductase
MRYITIPGIATPLSRIALGTVAFSPDNYARAAEVLDAFVALEGNTIDTGHIYSSGGSERAIGRWLQERGKRADMVIVDKGCHPYRDSGPRVTPEIIHTDLAESLECLQTDYIDLYLLHRDDERKPVGPLVEALNEERAAGSIRAFGASNWSTARIAEANAYAAEHGLAGFAASSPNLSLARPKEPMWAGCVSTTDAVRAWHTATQLPLLSWSSQAGGFLSGRFTREDTSNPDMLRVWYSDENFERLRRAAELGRREGVGPIPIALAYVLSQPFPTIAAVGPLTVAELRESFQALSIGLTPQDLAYLDLADQEVKIENRG